VEWKPRKKFWVKEGRKQVRGVVGVVHMPVPALVVVVVVAAAAAVVLVLVVVVVVAVVVVLSLH
jgi:hypothetical protein